MAYKSTARNHDQAQTSLATASRTSARPQRRRNDGVRETSRITDAAPDAVILDLEVGLQADYGVQMAQQLRAEGRYATMPIVVATAHGEGLDGGWQTLHDIGVPVRVIHGSADPLFPLAHGEALAAAIPGSTLVRLDGGGHGVDEVDWAVVIEAIAEISGTRESV